MYPSYRRNCALFLFLGMLVGCGPHADDTANQRANVRPLVQVEVASATKKDISQTLELVGSFLPARRTVMVSEVDGVIEKLPSPKSDQIVVMSGGQSETLPIGIGAVVKKGDLLVKLDASDYERSLHVAETELEQAKCDLRKLLAWHRPEEVRRSRALFEEAEANAERAQKEFDRHERLIGKNAVSRTDYEQKETDLRRARALMAHANAQLEIAEAGPTKEEEAVARAAVSAAEAEVEHRKWKVEKTSIVAPYDAVLTDRYVDLGDRVTAMPRVEMMEVMDIRFLFAQVGIPERYGDRVKLRGHAVVWAEGVTENLKGSIVRVNDKVDPATRTFRIRVAVDNAQRRLRVGQFVRVLLDVRTSPDTLTVPRPAITYAGGQPSVFVYTDSSVRLKPVVLGIEGEQDVEVVSGLEEHERVVIDDPSVLSDGMPVQLRTQPETLASRTNRQP